MTRSKVAGPILAACLCLLATLGLGFCWGRSGRKAAEPAEAAEGKTVVATVRVAAMTRGKLEGRIAAFGTVVAAPGAAQTLSVAYECRLVSIAVSEGQAVAAGALLATVTDSPDALLTLEQARIEARSAETQLQQARSRHTLHLADNATLAQAQQAGETATARLKSLEARHMGGLHSLRALAPGVVVRLPAQAGAVVPAGGSLVELADTTRLEARLGVEPLEAAQLHAGSAATLTGMDAGSPSAAVRIRAVSPAIHPVTRMRDVYLSLAPGQPFLFGQAVRASLLAASSEGLLVPYASVLPEDGKNVLFTIRNQHAVRHEVRILAQNGDRLRIAGPELDPAEPVVIQGNYELQDGMAVRVEEPAP